MNDEQGGRLKLDTGLVIILSLLVVAAALGVLLGFVLYASAGFGGVGSTAMLRAAAVVAVITSAALVVSFIRHRLTGGRNRPWR